MEISLSEVQYGSNEYFNRLFYQIKKTFSSFEGLFQYVKNKFSTYLNFHVLSEEYDPFILTS